MNSNNHRGLKNLPTINRLVAIVAMVTLGASIASGQPVPANAQPAPFTIAAIKPVQGKTATAMTGRGTGMIPADKNVDRLRRAYVASFAIAEKSGVLFLSTPNKPDTLYNEMTTAMPQLVIPAGDGSTYTFMGKVAHFYPGYLFDSDSSRPLIFRLTAAAGLVLQSGKGRVTMPNGTVVALDRAK